MIDKNKQYYKPCNKGTKIIGKTRTSGFILLDDFKVCEQERT